MFTIHQYLKQLQKTLPRHLRQEVTTEVQSHLEELANEWVQRGFSRPDAERKAVLQFGSPRSIGNQWRRATGVVDWPDILLAALPILGITGLGWTFFGQHLSLAIYLAIFMVGAVIAWGQSWPTWWYAWLGWLFLALLVVPGTQWVFLITFPILVTVLAIDSWQHATLMTLPFTTYIAFVTLLERQQLATTGWGPGSLFPGNIVWLETAFSILWIAILAAGLRAARPSRRGIYLLAGLVGTQLIYVGALVLMVFLAKALPAYFITTLTARSVLLVKLPIALVTITATLYPFFVWLIARRLRQKGTAEPGLPA